MLSLYISTVLALDVWSKRRRPQTTSDDEKILLTE